MSAHVVILQPGWRWCNRCQGLFFAGNATKGTCPAGGRHVVNGSGAYQVPLTGLGQANWRWCRKCEGMFFHGNLNSDAGLSCGRCPVAGPAGGVHDPAFSAHYLLDLSAPFPEQPSQPNWRWCRRCEGLFFAGNGKGRCPAGPGGHDASASGNYNLVQ